jgi:plasmid stabilization system protein ParE
VIVLYTDEAKQDFRDYIEYVSPSVAARFERRLDTLIDDLASGLIDGPEARLLTGELVQSWPLYPTRIYYQRRGEVFYVMRIYHQKRRPIARRPRRRR